MNFWSFEGKISRVRYVIAGVLLLAIKYGLDLAISMRFGRDWSPLMYLSPRLNPLWSAHDLPRAYVIALFATAAPFAWAGVALSAKRLRDMGVHPFWAGLFFLPFLHWAFFAVLSVAAPGAVAGSLGLPLPGERFYLWVQAALLAIAGACYAVAARDPRTYRPIVAIAVVGRLAGFVLLGLATVGRPDLRGLWVVAFADLAFGVAHLVTGRRLWR